MESRHALTLTRREGPTETVRAGERETVLEAAEAAGVDLPVGCRTGACVTCVGRLVDGTLSHAREPRALERDQLDDGYALLCVAEPRTDCRIEVGVDVQRDLVTHPWE